MRLTGHCSCIVVSRHIETTSFYPASVFLSEISLFVGLFTIPFVHDKRDVFPTQIQTAVSICQFLSPGMVLYSSIDHHISHRKLYSDLAVHSF